MERASPTWRQSGERAYCFLSGFVNHRLEQLRDLNSVRPDVFAT